jgi:sugar lactone lactonase YvrE
MFKVCRNQIFKCAMVLLAIAVLAAPLGLWGAKKKKEAEQPAQQPQPEVKIPDFRELVVFPSAPAIPRVRYQDYFSAEKPSFEQSKAEQKKQSKSSWMDRLAGVSPDAAKTRSGGFKSRFQLLAPYGVAVDSKGRLYVADTKVGAVFIFNPANNDVELIKNRENARFSQIFGLAMDDNDSLFVSDGDLHHILLFNPQHKVEAVFGGDDLRRPGGMAIDYENRLLYVCDAELDQVVVFDADTHKVVRKLGTPGKQHTLTGPGDFSKPMFVAVDKEGLAYVTDTMNDRVEVFDADGTFIRTWGKNGDGAGDFARPKGIAIDSDGHIWVADAMLSRIQVFTPDGGLLLAFGNFGALPGQFQALTGMAFDQKNNRIYAAEQYLGRVQMFRYYTNDEARAELKRRQEELAKKAAEKRAQAAAAATGAAVSAGSASAVEAKQPESPAAAMPDTPK